LRDWLVDMGYSVEEIRDKFGSDLGAYTLRDVLHFAARRRHSPRFNEATDEFILDGPVRIPRSVDSVDAEIQEAGD